MGERYVRNVQVRGSIPLISTNKINNLGVTKIQIRRFCKRFVNIYGMSHFKVVIFKKIN